MKIASLFGQGKTVFSFEVFPPKKTTPIETIYDTLNQLKELSPDFISVTYGAGGSTSDTTTCDIATYIKDKLNISSVAHLTCVYSTWEMVLKRLSQFRANGIENILALRGDINPERPRIHDFEYASDMIEFIKANGEFCISGACYPECHFEAPDVKTDIHNLKKKVDAGAQHLISQLFFDNTSFYNFIEKARIAGIEVPIEAGIMPVVNAKQIQHIVSVCGASFPAKFTRIIQKYENNPEALRDAGIAYATDQIVDLISNGAEGIHLYTMNNPYVAKRISDNVRSML